MPTADIQVISYPKTRQDFSLDCGANAIVSILVFARVEERGDRIAPLARTTKNGTNTVGVLRVLRYYGLPHRAGQRMKVGDLQQGSTRVSRRS